MSSKKPLSRYPSNPPLQADVENIYKALGKVDTYTTTDPNTAVTAELGTMFLLSLSSVFRLTVNTNGSTQWREIPLVTSSTFTIDSSGNVGIGTASPKFFATYPIVGITNPIVLSIYNSSNNRPGVLEVGGFSPGLGIGNSPAIVSFVSNDVGTFRQLAGLYGFADGSSSAGGIAFTTLTSGTNSTEKMRITSGGSVGIGTTSPNATAILDLTSTTLGFLPPRMTTTQRNAITSPAAGLVIYNTTTNKLNVFTTAWEAVTSA